MLPLHMPTPAEAEHTCGCLGLADSCRTSFMKQIGYSTFTTWLGLSCAQHSAEFIPVSASCCAEFGRNFSHAPSSRLYTPAYVTLVNRSPNPLFGLLQLLYVLRGRLHVAGSLAQAIRQPLVPWPTTGHSRLWPLYGFPCAQCATLTSSFTRRNTFRLHRS